MIRFLHRFWELLKVMMMMMLVFLYFLQELKFPSRAVETNPSSWPWFYRMNDAMEGRFASAAPILTPIVEDEDEDSEPLSSTSKKRARRSRGGMTEFLTESEMDLLVDNEDKNRSSAPGELHRITEFTYKRKTVGMLKDA